MENFSLLPEDYIEAGCPLCSPNKRHTVPISRILEKADEYFAANDYAGAEKHLLYWLEEARQSEDRQGILSLMNECIGLYRKTDKREKALSFSDDTIKFALDAGYGDSVTMGTTYINAATAYVAFGDSRSALPLYEKAKTLYEQLLSPADKRLGGLYNNMALAVAAMGDHPRARELFQKALSVMLETDGGETGAAITYCNLADLTAKEDGIEAGEEQIGKYLEEAMTLLDKISMRRDAEYAYCCEKCAPTFGLYGYFLYEKTLDERARSIYEGH